MPNDNSLKKAMTDMIDALSAKLPMLQQKLYEKQLEVELLTKEVVQKAGVLSDFRKSLKERFGEGQDSRNLETWKQVALGYMKSAEEVTITEVLQVVKSAKGSPDHVNYKTISNFLFALKKSKYAVAKQRGVYQLIVDPSAITGALVNTRSSSKTTKKVTKRSAAKKKRPSRKKSDWIPVAHRLFRDHSEVVWTNAALRDAIKRDANEEVSAPNMQNFLQRTLKTGFITRVEKGKYTWNSNVDTSTRQTKEN